MLGFARGVNADNTLGMMDDGTYSSELRSEKEPIKHKILDLFGDFYLTGVSILDMKAQILVKEAGHAVHIKVAKELKDKLIKIIKKCNARGGTDNISIAYLVKDGE